MSLVGEWALSSSIYRSDEAQGGFKSTLIYMAQQLESVDICKEPHNLCLSPTCKGNDDGYEVFY
jgi:hypothetical protein